MQKAIVFGKHRLIFDLLSVQIIQNMEVIVIDQDLSFLEYVASAYDVHTINSHILDITSLKEYLHKTRNVVLFALSMDEPLNITASIMIKASFDVKYSFSLLEKTRNIDNEIINKKFSIDHFFSMEALLLDAVLSHILHFKRITPPLVKQDDTYLPLYMYSINEAFNKASLSHDQYNAIIREDTVYLTAKKKYSPAIQYSPINLYLRKK